MTPSIGEAWSFPPPQQPISTSGTTRNSRFQLPNLRRFWLRVALAATLALGLLVIARRTSAPSNQQMAIAAIRESGGIVMMAASGSNRYSTDRSVGTSGPIESIEVYNPHVVDAVLWDTGVLNHPQALLVVRAPLGNADLARLAPFDNLHTLDLLGERVTDESLIHLQELARLETLSIRSELIGRDGLRSLRQLARIRQLALCGPGITDDGLAELCHLPTLRELTITNTQISDVGLHHVARMENLNRLNIANNNITDAGLVHLHELSSLMWINLERTNVTDAGVATLQLHLPLCREYRGR